jgi:hypothetical protein
VIGELHWYELIFLIVFVLVETWWTFDRPRWR